LNRVAVTGIGLVCALGNNVAEAWPKLASGECGIKPLAAPGAPAYKFQLGAQALTFDPLRYFSEKDLIVLERFAQFAAVAAREGITQSGLLGSPVLSEDTAVITGTSVGGQFTEEEGYIRLYRENNPRVAPLTIPRTMSNAGASRISLEYGIRGPVYTVSTACSSSNHAIGQAFQMVRSGQVKAAIAGGSEAVFAEGLLRAWEAMRVVSPEVCRPFSADRRGLSLGEGAGMLVLENWEYAQERGAEVLAEVIGFGMSSDAHHITQPSVEGPKRAIRWALRDAGLEPSAVDAINAHGTGTQANDAMEADAIRSIWQQDAARVLVTSTKSMHGHTLGAAGGIEAVITVLSLQNGIVPPTAGFNLRDAACDLNIAANTPVSAPLQVALSNTFAFGGLNATIVFRRASG
jgi:nodulation protein E